MSTIGTAQEALRALATLKSLTTYPTPEQTCTMAKWPGWGPLAQAFEAKPQGGWNAIADQIETLLGNDKDAAASAANHLDTSFFTPANVVDAIFQLLRATGFTGGSVLEPGCGSGRFMAATPEDMDIQWTGVEIDPTSAAFAALLNPTANIINQPLQKATFKSGGFDAAIGNVPFSSAHVFDPAYENASLHEYFLLRAIDAVRHGGYVILVTSRFTMDSEAGLLRAKGRADFVGSVRLPSGTFGADGTDVVTDIVVLRRNDTPYATKGWERIRSTRERDGRSLFSNSSPRISQPLREGLSAHPVDVSWYWLNHPEQVAGEMRATGNRHNALAVISETPAEDIQASVAALKPWMTPIPARKAPEGASLDDVVLEDAGGRPEGSFHLTESTIMQVINGQLSPVVRPTKELRALVGLRDAAAQLVDLESDPYRPAEEIAPARTAALSLYEAYVAAFGPLNRGTLHTGKPDPDTGMPSISWRRPSLSGFRKDPGYTSVMALEEYDQDSSAAKPAPILLRRINARPAPAESAETPGEALAISMGEGCGVDLARIGSLLSSDSEEATIAALGDKVYADPDQQGRFILDRDYLSGNVRSKLRQALTAAAHDAAYERNVTALQAVMPEDLGPMEIKAALGAPWVLAKDVQDFMRETLGTAPNVTHTAVVATWELSSTEHRVTEEVALTWGTARMNPFTLIEHALNGKTPIVYDESYEAGKKVKTRNNDQTLAAEEKMRDIQDRFGVWIWEDKERAERICTEYNRLFNSHTARRADGSYLTFPGMAADVNLWPWQKDIVDRMVSSERVLCGHAVGSGKTKSMLASAMTLRRFGLASKPLIAVPNHLLEQIAREAQQTFPTGKFLVAAKEDMTGDARRLFAARCANGDYDLVVMTHNAFTSLSVDPSVELDWLEDQKAELRWHLQQGGDGRGAGAKQIARTLRSFESRIEGLRYNTADEKQVTFEQLGIDWIAVDEAHYMKRLPIATRAEGFSLGSSKRATDLLLKINSLAKRHPKKPIVGLFTGTPWSNTLAETFVWQTYLQPDRLMDAGVHMFDAWAANFVRYETRVEVTPDGGGFRLNRRPSVIQNFPELRGMLSEVADLLPADSINLQRPDHTTETIVVEPTPNQRAFVKSLSDRADALRNGMKADNPSGQGKDNMLVICSDGRKMALDSHLVGIAGGSPKVERIAQEITRIYHDTKDTLYGDSKTPGALQAVFSDIGTPHPGDTQTYGRLRSRLIELGIPAERIRWIHEANTDKAKAALFSACRDGSVSVILGSTDKMGVGTNIQHRLRALHHLDAPWRPSDIEQREGRALRPGNLNPFVAIFRYITKYSFDAYLWQILERKARFIAQIYKADGAVREIEDISDVVLDFGHIKALAAGNPKLLNIATLKAEVRKLRTLYAVHKQGVNNAHKRAERATKNAAAARRNITLYSDAIGEVARNTREPNLPNLDAFVTGLLEGRAPFAAYRGLTLQGTTDSYSYGKPKQEAGAEVTLRIMLSYSDVEVLTLKKKHLRHKDGTAYLMATVDGVIDGLAEAVREAHRLVVRYEAEATEAVAAAGRAKFSGADALAKAERELDVVEAEITAEAAEATAPQPVAA